MRAVAAVGAEARHRVEATPASAEEPKVKEAGVWGHCRRDIELKLRPQPQRYRRLHNTGGGVRALSLRALSRRNLRLKGRRCEGTVAEELKVKGAAV